MEKSLSLLLSVTTPCMRCGNHFDTISWQCVVCAGRTYHHAASRPMSPRSIVITLTCMNLWQWVVRISATVSRSQRGRQRQWRIIRLPSASLQNTVVLPPPHASHL